MMIIENKFNIGDIVYICTDIHQQPSQVVRIAILPGGLLYQLARGTTTSEHYEFELTSEKDISVCINNDV